MKKIYLFLAAVLSTASYSQIVISQAYGGGGNAGSTFTHDFVELFNRGNAAVNIENYSIQYASATGSNWSKTVLPNFVLQPGQYYLVQQAQGAAGTTPLPAPDFITVAGTGPDDPGNQLAMSGTKFKLVLANTDVTITSATDSQVIDLLGIADATASEGTAAPILSNATAALRNGNGCTDTNNNLADFTVATPTPRNSTSPVNVCNLGVKENSISGLNVYPNPVKNGNLYITSDSNETKSVVIYDVLGKQVVKANVINQVVNVSNLNAGVYIVKITEAGKTATRKLVIE